MQSVHGLSTVSTNNYQMQQLVVKEFEIQNNLKLKKQKVLKLTITGSEERN